MILFKVHQKFPSQGQTVFINPVHITAIEDVQNDPGTCMINLVDSRIFHIGQPCDQVAYLVSRFLYPEAFGYESRASVVQKHFDPGPFDLSGSGDEDLSNDKP